MTILKLIWLTVLYERPPCVSGTCSNNDDDDDDDNVLYTEYNIYRFTVGPHANAYACIVVIFAG